jgi:hypothetical protein
MILVVEIASCAGTGVFRLSPAPVLQTIEAIDS